MAIKTFKEIIDNKGYRISTKDREIFEEGNLQSFFGFSDSDMIEFIVYDANENQLPKVMKVSYLDIYHLVRKISKITF